MKLNYLLLYLFLFFSVLNACHSSSRLVQDVENMDSRQLIHALKKSMNEHKIQDEIHVVFTKDIQNSLGNYFLFSSDNTMIGYIILDWHEGLVVTYKKAILDANLQYYDLFIALIQNKYSSIPDKFLDKQCNGCRSVIHFVCVLKKRRVKVLYQNVLSGPWLYIP
jgi:hypothetical protein